jgi:hypothetical protein
MLKYHQAASAKSIELRPESKPIVGERQRCFCSFDNGDSTSDRSGLGENRMFKKISALLMFSLLSSFAYAAGSTERPNAVSFELLGRGLLYSLDYDRQVTDEVAIGIGYSQFGQGEYDKNGVHYDAIHITVIPVYLNYYLENSGTQRWYITGGLDFVSGTISSNGFSDTGSGVGIVAGGGYEYRSDSGFLFRATPYIVASTGGARLWGGLTFGYAF